MIPYGRQDVRPEDVDAVVEVLRSDYLTQGPVTPRFEAAMALRCAPAEAVAMNSATSALHAACLALGLGEGDRLWTSPITFVASSNAALYCGAEVDFVDVDPTNANLSVAALERKLVAAEAAGRLPKIVVPVHLCGEPCDMAAIGALARRYGFKVIEDASHAVGASDRGAPVGSCLWSDVTVFSFHPVKIITTGEGGMAMTRDPALAERLRLLRSHGITRDPAQMVGEPAGAWDYQQILLGYNYRMTDIQSALGLSQMARLDAYVERRFDLAARYDALLADLPARPLKRSAESRSAGHLYVVRVAAERRKAVFDQMRAAGIGVNLHYIPVHTQPYYAALGFQRGDFPEAEAYSAEAITLPLHPALSEAEQDLVVSALAAALRA